MKTNPKAQWHGCPMRYAAGMFADKWCFLLLRDILFKGKRFYGDFLTAGEGISTNILADRLARLEREGIISRHRDAAKRSRVYYLPTIKAKALMPALLEMMLWSACFDAKTQAPADFVTGYRDDPVGSIKRYLDEIERVNTKVKSQPN